MYITTKRRIAALGASTLLAFSLTACGGGAPTDASEKEFCDARDKLDSSMTKLGDDPDPGEAADAFNKAGEDLEKVGTPESISDEEREGFEIQVDALKGVDEDAIKDLEKAIADGDEDASTEALGVSEDDSKKSEAFIKYAQETCA